MGNTTHKEPGIETGIWCRKERAEGEEDKGDQTHKRQQQKGREWPVPTSKTVLGWNCSQGDGAGRNKHLDKKAQGKAGREFAAP